MGQNQISFKLKFFLWINGIHTIMNYLFKNTLFYFFSQLERFEHNHNSTYENVFFSLGENVGLKYFHTTIKIAND